MKRIFYLRTYYQIIFALQIVNTLCKNDEVTFLISDDSKGADGIVQDLCKFDIVRNILWVETKRLTYEKHMSEKILDLVSVSLLETNQYKRFLQPILNKRYDEFIFYNYGVDTVAVNGAAATGNTEKIDQEWYENTLNKLKPYAKALNLQLVGISGNIDLLYINDRCLNGDTVVTSSFVYALQKLFGIYYWGSTYPTEIFAFCEEDGGFFENVSVQYVTTRAIRFYHSGSEINRVGKVRYIADNAIVQKGLTVCGDASGKNCGRPQCPKCMRTMAELKAVGKLQYFSKAFPVEDYEKHFASRLAMEMTMTYYKSQE